MTLLHEASLASQPPRLRPADGAPSPPVSGPGRRSPRWPAHANRVINLVVSLGLMTAVSWAAGIELATPDGSGFIQPADSVVAKWLSTHRPGAVLGAARAASLLGGTIGAVTLALAAGWWLQRRTRRTILAVLPIGTVAATQVVVQTTKWLVDRPRPTSPLATAHAAGAAFPSGHAATATALAVVLGLLIRRVTTRRGAGRLGLAAAAISAVTISASRIVLGVHWASDVIAGVAIGAAVAALALHTLRRREGPRRPRRHLPQTARLLVAGTVLAMLVPVGSSYLNTLRAPGFATVDTRTVDWLRTHQLSPIVDRAESWWLWRHMPSPNASINALPPAPVTTIPLPPSTSTAHATSTALASATPTPIAPAAATAPPADLEPAVLPQLPGEGSWSVAASNASGAPQIATTSFRPDPTHPSVTATAAWMNNSTVRFSLVAGTREPAGSAGPWKGTIPADLRAQLLAAFNSGYKMKDTPGGALVEGRRTRSLQNGIATLAIRSDGTATVGAWGRDLTPSADIVAARQNLHLVVDSGQLVPGLRQNVGARWGNVKNALPTWRSGVGVDTAGNVVYVSGADLTLDALGEALRRAGAHRAMELDIHKHMVTYNLFTHPDVRGDPVGHKLSPDMTEPADRYLKPDQRDFVAVFAR